MTTQQANQIMRKPLELWQFVISLLGLIMTAGILIVNQSNKITSQEIRISDLEQNKRDTQAQFDKVNSKLDAMNDQLTHILIALEDKVTRQGK